MTSAPNVTTVDSGAHLVCRRVTVSAEPATVFDLVADPRRHGELDGSGTVHDIVSGPDRLGLGDTFSVKMSLIGIPYRITSTVTGFEENALLEWQHPLGHRWRWEFAETAPGHTQVTETWDYRGSRHIRFLEIAKYPRINGQGITRTLEGLRTRFA
jgi:Polyketide cyclase / dehydrase and lipid transport